MVAACAFAAPGAASTSLLAATALLLAARIHVEEKVLDDTGDYRTYRSAVRWRLLPGLW